MEPGSAPHPVYDGGVEWSDAKSWVPSVPSLHTKGGPTGREGPIKEEACRELAKMTLSQGCVFVGRGEIRLC